MTSTSPSDLPELLDQIRDVEGWMSDGQAAWLWETAGDLHAGQKVVEIGSFRGRSMAVIASAAGDGVELIAIDPHGGGDRGPNEIADDSDRGNADNEAFWATLENRGVADRVRLVRKRSDEAHSDVEGDIDLLYIDGAHRFSPARADIRSWGARVAPGGTMLIHDSFNSLGVTGAQAAELFWSDDFSYVGRSRSMARYVKNSPRGSQKRKSLISQLAEAPYFAWALIVKVLVAVGLGGLTKHLGNPEGTWPY